MDKKEFEFLLKQGEGLKLEFKESFDSKGFAKEIVAFTNSEGGKIFLGINDKGEVKGIEITNKLKSQIQDIANNCDPPIKINLEEVNKVLVIEVSEGENKPYKCSSGFFVRIGPNSQSMKRDEIVKMILGLGNKRFDEMITEVKRYDTELVKFYLKKAGLDIQIDKNTLFNLGVADSKGHINNAGILFFTKNPKKYLINAYISCARYKGTEKVNVIDRKDFEGDLISQIENSIDFIKRNTKLSYEIKGLYRKDIPEYPIEAIREAILNAVMHRNYFEKGANVQVDIFDNKLTITNIGGLIKPLTKEKLGTLAIRRNPLIADLFHRIHLVEKMGTGIKRIKEECKKHGNIKFEVDTNGYFIAEFRLKKKISNAEKTSEKTSEKIILLIKQNPEISAKRLSKELSISSRAVEMWLAKLKEGGLIKRVGADKGGHWEVIEND